MNAINICRLIDALIEIALIALVVDGCITNRRTTEAIAELRASQHGLAVRQEIAGAFSYANIASVGNVNDPVRGGHDEAFNGKAFVPVVDNGHLRLIELAVAHTNDSVRLVPADNVREDSIDVGGNAHAADYTTKED